MTTSQNGPAMSTEPAPGRLGRSDVVWTVLLTLVVFGPLLLGTGYWLFGDMVFVPQQPWKGAWLGLDGALPRAVPMDALVSVASHVVPGWVLQRLLLMGGFVAGGLGAARLVRLHSRPARMAAISLFLWNPWVLERLAIGQWSILDGYLLLPWVALAAVRVRGSVRRGTPALFLALLASAVCSPSSAMMAALVALVVGVERVTDWRRILAVLAMSIVASAPWLVPTFVASTSTITTSGVFGDFAARGESGLGTLASLLSLGGTWKASIVPSERASAVVVLLAGCLTVLALVGLRYRRRDPREPGTARLVTVASVSLLLAWLPSLGVGADALEALGSVLPGTATLRDSHRFLAPAALLLTVGLAGLVDAVGAQVRPGRSALRGVIGLLVLAPILLLPSLAWGLGRTAQLSTYPEEWAQVARIISTDAEARTVVLPWAGSYRSFTWNDRRAVLDPAPRYFPGEVLVDDSILLGSDAVPSEDPAVAQVADALASNDPAAALRALDVRWVLVEQQVPGEPVPDGRVVHEGPGLTLLDLGPDHGLAENPANRSGDPLRSATILIVDLVVLIAAMCMTVVLVRMMWCEWRSDQFREDASDEGGSS